MPTPFKRSLMTVAKGIARAKSRDHGDELYIGHVKANRTPVEMCANLRLNFWSSTLFFTKTSNKRIQRRDPPKTANVQRLSWAVQLSCKGNAVFSTMFWLHLLESNKACWFTASKLTEPFQRGGFWEVLWRGAREARGRNLRVGEGDGRRRRGQGKALKGGKRRKLERGRKEGRSGREDPAMMEEKFADGQCKFLGGEALEGMTHRAQARLMEIR